jgi:hypothetical protein
LGIRSGRACPLRSTIEQLFLVSYGLLSLPGGIATSLTTFPFIESLLQISLSHNQRNISEISFDNHGN